MTDEIDVVSESEAEGPPIYIARKLADAKRLEEVFTAAGVEYDVEPKTFVGGLIFRSERVFAFFYVASKTWDNAVAVMQKNGFRPWKPLPPS